MKITICTDDGEVLAVLNGPDLYTDVDIPGEVAQRSGGAKDSEDTAERHRNQAIADIGDEIVEAARSEVMSAVRVIAHRAQIASSS